MPNSDEQASISALPRAEFGFPGPLRDRLVAAILDGSKTATTSLLIEYEASGEPLPVVGDRELVIDSDEQPVAVTEVTAVRVCRIDEVTLAHAIAEGEGFTSVDEWRNAHEEFWHSPAFRNSLADPGFTVDAATQVICVAFAATPLRSA